MIANLVVLAAVLFATIFVALWLVSPQLRAWIEKPKHRFHDAVKRYDRVQQRHGQGRQSS